MKVKIKIYIKLNILKIIFNDVMPLLDDVTLAIDRSGHLFGGFRCQDDELIVVVVVDVVDDDVDCRYFAWNE